MRISSATIDCYLSISAANYSDFEHHHWEILPSGPIGTMATNNIPTYTWTVNSIGSNGSGSWSTPMGQPVTVSNGAQAWMTTPATSTTPGTVSLKQTTNFGTHTIQAIGSNNATKHDVSEMIWVTPPPLQQDLITWNASAATPSMISYQDIGHPISHLQFGTTPVYGPRGSGFPFLLLPNITFSSPSVVGGRDWTLGLATFFQVPSPRNARAWWAWTINLVM
jgi:hypothetical protein